MWLLLRFQWTLWIELIRIYPGAQTTSSRLGLFPTLGFGFQRVGLIQVNFLILKLVRQIPTVWSGCLTLYSHFPDSSSETAENYYDWPVLGHISKQGIESMISPTQLQRLSMGTRRFSKKTRVLLADRRVDIGQPKTTDIVYSGALISKISFSSEIQWFVNFFPFWKAVDINKYSLRTSDYF